jgi:hypothetical protein
MNLARGVVVAVVVAMATAAQAAPGEGERRADAPRLLKEGLAAGNADLATFAAIADWILHEKEEKVAAGLADALAAVEPRLSGPDGQRWNATAEAMLSLFRSALADARTHHRRSDAEIEADVAAVAAAAAPAISATLAEVDPKVWAPFREALQHALPNACEPPPAR